MNGIILYAVTYIPSCVQMGELGGRSDERQHPLRFTNIPSCIQVGELGGRSDMNGIILCAVTNIPSCVQMGELGGRSDERHHLLCGH